MNDDPRIDVVAAKYFFASAPIPAPHWDDVPLERQLVCRAIARDLLAAADAVDPLRTRQRMLDEVSEIMREVAADDAEVDG